MSAQSKIFIMSSVHREFHFRSKYVKIPQFETFSFFGITKPSSILNFRIVSSHFHFHYFHTQFRSLVFEQHLKIMTTIKVCRAKPYTLFYFVIFKPFLRKMFLTDQTCRRTTKWSFIGRTYVNLKNATLMGQIFSVDVRIVKNNFAPP